MSFPPQSLERRLPALALAGSILLGLVQDTFAAAPPPPVGISEFMAANSRTLADDHHEFSDWIELRNSGTSPVDLAGWSLSTDPRNPRQWTFPATNLPPSGHLIVWASGRDRRVPGSPLHAGFKLDRDGDYLALRAPDGTVVTEFAPRYPPQWPDVSFGFLPDRAELVAFSRPTPGRANESSPARPGPLILAVQATPQPPMDGQPLTITATLAGPTNAARTVTLLWRPLFQAEQSLAMTRLDDSRWSATLPPAATTSPRPALLRWRIVAEDPAGARSSYPPESIATRTSKYLGTRIGPGLPPNQLPVFEFFVAPADLRRIDTESGGTGCLVHDGEFYDNVFVKVRGNTTAHFPKKSHRVEFPADHPLRVPGSGGRIRNTSFMAEWGDPTYLRQHLSFWLLAQSGSVAPSHEPARLQLNGEFWQLAMHSEVLGRDLLVRHHLDPRGSLYKAVGTLEVPSQSTGGFEKKTRRWEDTGDFDRLCANLGEDLSLARRRRTLFDQFNLPAVINYLAVARLSQEDDDIWANLSLYHDNDGTDEWQPIAFDMNVSWGLSFLGGGIRATDDKIRSHPFFGARDTGWLQGYNRLYDAVVQVPETRAMLVRRMRTILDQWWMPPDVPADQRVLDRHVAEMTRRIAGDAALDRARWGNPWTLPGDPPPDKALALGVSQLLRNFIEPRRRHFYITHGVESAGLLKRVGITCRDLAGIPAAQPENASILISDAKHVQGHPERDALVLTNPQPYAVDISGWSIRGGASLTFAGGTVLPPAGVLYAVRDVRAFRAGVAPPPGTSHRFVTGPLRGAVTDLDSLELLDHRGRRLPTRP